MTSIELREKILDLMQKLKIYAPESMVNRLSDSGIKTFVSEKSEKLDGYLLLDKSVFNSLPPLPVDDFTDNKLVFLRNSNDLEFIFNLYQICSSGLLPILISPLTTESEVEDFIERFKPGGVLDSGVFQKVIESIPAQKVNENDAVVILTSGSSGIPKAVVHTFLSLSKAAERGNNAMGVNGQDRWLLSLPLHHISGFLILFRCIAGSIPLVLAESLNPSDKEFDAALKLGPSLVSFVPSQLRDFLTSGKAATSNFRHILVGGSAVDSTLIKSSLEANLRVSKVYGSSETAAFVAITDYDSLKEDIKMGALLYRE
ncbi:MAG: AMP-binding protein [Ignavibacteriales bacterium]|nr:AMP-binding protein [Ignavibacteriales bacterium]